MYTEESQVIWGKPSTSNTSAERKHKQHRRKLPPIIKAYLNQTLTLTLILTLPALYVHVFASLPECSLI